MDTADTAGTDDTDDTTETADTVELDFGTATILLSYIQQQFRHPVSMILTAEAVKVQLL